MRKHYFGDRDFEIESEEIAYRGFFSVSKFRLRHRLFDGGWSESLTRELFQRGDAVGILVFDPKHDLVGVVEQFRIGAIGSNYGPWQYEVIAGMVGKGDNPSDVARDELKQEAGLEADRLIPICDYFVSAGGSDEKMFLFCALIDLEGKGGVFGLPSENEDIMFQVWTFEEMQEAFYSGYLNSAAMTISFQWLQNNRKEFYDRNQNKHD